MSILKPLVPLGWQHMSNYDKKSKILVGIWVKTKREGEPHWDWQVEPYEQLYLTDLDWGDLDDYEGFILLPQLVRIEE